MDVYLGELAHTLHVRGQVRRRFLVEVRDHLTDLAATVGEDEAVLRFGPPALLAAEFDLACSTRRGVRAGWGATIAIAATGASTLALVHAADTGVPSPLGWAVVFFLSAQVAAVCAALIAVQALRLRRSSRGAADVALLQRRAFVGLAAAALTIFAAGAAQPGEASPLVLLGGPIVGLAAGVALLRSWRLNRQLTGGGDTPPAHNPVAERRYDTFIQKVTGPNRYFGRMSDEGGDGWSGKRGYESIEKKLRGVGAKIKRAKDV